MHELSRGPSDATNARIFRVDDDDDEETARIVANLDGNRSQELDQAR